MMNNLICCSTNCEINVQTYKVQNMTFSSRKYLQKSLYITICTVINVQIIAFLVPLYVITTLFYRSLKKWEYISFVCTFISGEIKTKNNSYLKAGDNHA